MTPALRLSAYTAQSRAEAGQSYGWLFLGRRQMLDRPQPGGRGPPVPPFTCRTRPDTTQPTNHREEPMRQARVIFRPDGIYGPPRDQLRSIMFMVGLDDHPTTPADCRIYEPPIRAWLARARPGDDVTEIWFSRPEILVWEPRPAPRCGQDIVVEGGVILRTGPAYRLLLELHDSFCTCAWCQDEEIVAGESEWIPTHVPAS
jgi:hypothetical protein